MIREKVDILIIGAGPAGLAAAIAAREDGIDSLLVLEREISPGGILNLKSRRETKVFLIRVNLDVGKPDAVLRVSQFASIFAAKGCSLPIIHFFRKGTPM